MILKKMFFFIEIKIYLLCGVLSSVSGQFFHETSGVTLKPSGSMATAFGFSIAYQNHAGSPARLVVGAPRQDYVGKVYSCPLSDLSSINCSVIDMTSLKIEEKTAAAREASNPNTNYFFGSSIVATSNYFFTCAPLLTKTININRMEFTDTFGGCYVNPHATSGYTEWIDRAARLGDKNEKQISFDDDIDEEIKGGALGWNTLVDDSFLIAAKSGLKTDILYTNADQPLKNASRSLLEDNMSTHPLQFKNYLNLGYGLAAGNFFNKSEKLYAVSVRTDSNEMILFLQKKYEGSGYRLEMMLEIGFRRRLAYIEVNTQSTMFGYAIAAADLNRDGLSELLVGAPAQTEDGRRELGALHVFVGGDLISRNDKKRMRTVLADKVNGRFGSAIATSDIDGDSLPEIFVSAPYEDSGVVYVLSGYELKQVFFSEKGFKLARLSALKRTQELRGDAGLELFGFSLQVVKDVDQNGCDELAIGAPANSSVKLVRCLPAVNTSLTLELLGDSIVAVDAKSFTVNVCLSVTINKKCQSVSGNISVESFTTGHSKILSPTFTYNIKKDKKLQCNQIKVDLTKSAEKTDYIFTTKLSMSADPNPSVYNSRAVFSAYSKTEKSLTVRRYCSGVHCEPDLMYKMFWSGNDYIDFTTPEAMNDTLTYQITNANSDAYYVVLELLIRGAFVRSGECDLNKDIINVNNDVKVYTCALGKILRKGDSYIMTIPLYLPAPTNRPSMDISAKLYDGLFQNKTFKGKSLVIPYKLKASDVTVNGSSNIVNITDNDLKKDGITNVASCGIQQEFIISNDGPVTWYGILAVLQVKNEYIQHVKIVTQSENDKWVLQHYHNNDSNKFIYHNRMTIMPKSKKIIAVTMCLFKDKLESDISNGDLSIISNLAFVLDPLFESREAKSQTQIIYNRILSFGNTKWMIVLSVFILAIFLLLIMILVLYKLGFFKRDEKKKLSVLRENIKNQSVGLASENSRGTRTSVEEGDHCDIEVYDDGAFQEVEIAPSTTRSNLSLIETSQ